MSVDDYINHPLNTSHSKNTCSFLRNRRFFPDLSPKSYDLTYQVPDFRNKRTCSFGVGNKTNLCNKAASPPPNNYNIKSSFDFNETKGFSFGLGREQATFGAALNVKKRANTMPGPGEYPLPSTLANNSIYIGAKLDSFAVRRGSRDVPGPGLYSLKQTEVNNTGKYVLSNYVNPLSPSFRNKTIEADSSNKKLRRFSNIGPGSYNSSDTLNAQGKYTSSKFPSSRVRSFGRGRRGSMLQKSKIALPGPGTYTSFSEFGKVKDISKASFEIRVKK